MKIRVHITERGPCLTCIMPALPPRVIRRTDPNNSRSASYSTSTHFHHSVICVQRSASAVAGTNNTNARQCTHCRRFCFHSQYVYIFQILHLIGCRRPRCCRQSSASDSVWPWISLYMLSYADSTFHVQAPFKQMLLIDLRSIAVSLTFMTATDDEDELAVACSVSETVPSVSDVVVSPPPFNAADAADKAAALFKRSRVCSKRACSCALRMLHTPKGCHP